jgi:hypothetical protein
LERAVTAATDRESPRALRYGDGSVTRIVAPDGNHSDPSVVLACG